MNTVGLGVPVAGLGVSIAGFVLNWISTHEKPFVSVSGDDTIDKEIALWVWAPEFGPLEPA